MHMLQFPLSSQIRDFDHFLDENKRLLVLKIFEEWREINGQSDKLQAIDFAK